MKRLLLNGLVTGFAAMIAGLLVQCQTACAQAVEPSNEAKWYFSPAIGWQDWQGDEEQVDAFMMTARLGYDLNEWWGFEGLFYIAPSIKEQMRWRRYPADYGDFTWVSMSDNTPGEKFGSTFAAGIAVDALFHFTRWERLDPYLAAGLGITWYGEEINNERFDPVIRAGGGVMYHFNDEWAVRADFRALLAGSAVEQNSMIDAGVVWTWGARIPPSMKAIGGPDDTDRDGLTDAEEGKIGTNPFDPDTDRDELLDGEEVKQYKTDPLNPDTDYDGLRDGEEVKKYKTNPLERDTDKGGVADGHEVLEDNTDPNNPADDLVLFELYMQFDYDKSIVKPEYFGQLDVIAKVLRRHPNSTARIEGHADQTKKSGAPYNRRLSKQRAEAVLDHISKSGVEKSRMKPVGYGFDRPKEKPDLMNGNPKNRRVEIYIRGAQGPEVAEAQAAIKAAQIIPPSPEGSRPPAPEVKAAPEGK